MQLHDTYFVVGHLHYVIFGGMGFGLFAAFHYWLPKITGKMYNKRIAVAAWLILFTGFNFFYFPVLIMGLQGMPRRYYNYLPQFSSLLLIASIGAFIMVGGIIFMAVNLIRGVIKGGKGAFKSVGWCNPRMDTPLPACREKF